MVEIKTGGRIVKVPTMLEELTPHQYRYYCMLAGALTGGVMDVEHYRKSWFSFLLGLERMVYTMLVPERIKEIEEQLPLMNDFLIPERTENGTVLRPDFDTCVNLLPAYHGHEGPGDWMHGVKFGEFVECITELETAVATQATGDDLRECCRHIARVLYHIPERENVSTLLENHAVRLLASVWKAIQAGPIEINGKKIDFTIIFKGGDNSRPDDKTGWAGITFEVASAGVFGTVKEVEATEFWDVLLYLYKCKFEYNHDKSRK